MILTGRAFRKTATVFTLLAIMAADTAFSFSSNVKKADSKADLNYEKMIVIGSFSSSIEAVKQKKFLESKIDRPLQIVASSDCVNLKKDLYLVVISDRKMSISYAREKIPDSYERRCELISTSVMKYNIDAVDSSFALVKIDPINWSSKDTVAQLVSILYPRKLLIIRPYYLNVQNDPSEGLNAAVEIHDLNKNNIAPLINECRYANVNYRGAFIAVSCANEQIADQVVYTTKIFSAANGSLSRTLNRCAKPVINVTKKLITCEMQIIDKNGNIKTISKTVKLQ